MSDDFSFKDSAVDAMKQFASEIFGDSFVMDDKIRTIVSRMLIDSGKFVDMSGDKYDLSMISQGIELQKQRNPFDMKKIIVHVTAGLSASQKNQLILNNSDVDIVFSDTTTMPHSVAYAQRIIDTTRCMALAGQKGSVILDIGGNYASHSMKMQKYEVHSCTLYDNVVEGHRQTQRNVQLQLADVHPGSYCTVGVQNCQIQASHGISIHTLPEIDPELVSTIFMRHGLEHVEGVHHYDPEIERSDAGYMAEIEMHWKVTKDLDHVEFFFDNDSSFSYRHRRDWLLEYAVDWSRTEDDWDYLVHYQVDYIIAGVLKWTMTRMRKDTIGQQESVPQFRVYHPEDVVEVLLPKYDQNSGMAVSDPRAYTVTMVPVPTSMFSHLYMFGISNNTERPDLPLTLEQVKAQAHSYNYLKQVAGTPMTTKKVLGTKLLQDIAMAMYLLIVKKAATNAVIVGKYTKQMIRVQQRWGSESFFHLASRSFTNIALTPFIMLSDSFSDVVDLMAVRMRISMMNDKVVASVQDVLPYRILPDVLPIHGSATHALQKHKLNSFDFADYQESVPVQQFYELFKDVMTDGVKDRFVTEIQSQSSNYQDEGDQSERIVDSSHEVESSNGETGQHSDGPVLVAEDGKTPSPVANLPSEPFDSQSWGDAMEMFENVAPEPLRGNFQISDSHHIMQTFPYAMYEYGLNMVDVALRNKSAVRENIRSTWSGDAPKALEINDRNKLYAYAIKYYREHETRILDMDESEPYQVCVDPVTFQCNPIVQRDGEYHTSTTSNGWVYVDESCRVFNNYKLAKAAIHESKVFRYREIVLRLVNGVPGCGKTHEIISNYSIDQVILSAAKDSQEDTLARLMEDRRFLDYHKELKQRVRTLDSVALGNAPRANKLQIDEGLLVSPGALALGICRTKATDVTVYGDEAQIGFIDRGSKVGILRYERMILYTHLEHRNETVRCPADVMWVYAQSLPEERRPFIKTRVPVMRSLEYIYQPDPLSPEYTKPIPTANYMTLLRDDKGRLVRSPGFVDGKQMVSGSSDRKVLSVHQAQGTTNIHSAVLRLNVYSVGTFELKEHRNVAFTRHMLKATFISTLSIDSDPWGKWIKRVQTEVTDETLREMMLPPPDWLRDKYDGFLHTHPQLF